MTTKISFILNGDKISYEIKDHWTLSHLLREEMGLIGTKEGCGNGECGACTVIVDKLAVNSCLYLAIDADDKTIETGQVTFFSRTKKRLWTKGEESGNFLNIVNIKNIRLEFNRAGSV